jgi:hypothetical protein
MGLWLKQGDDIIPVSGGGGGGTFEGEHVLTGDPDDPPTGWEEGQLLWDGNTTAYDGDEIINDGGGHNHENTYLSLDGGTIMGNLGVEGNLTARDTWTQDLAVDGTLSVSGASTTQDLAVDGTLSVSGAATVEGKRVVTVTTSNGTPPSGASEGDIHIQV